MTGQACRRCRCRRRSRIRATRQEFTVRRSRVSECTYLSSARVHTRPARAHFWVVRAGDGDSTPGAVSAYRRDTERRFARGDRIHLATAFSIGDSALAHVLVLALRELREWARLPGRSGYGRREKHAGGIPWRRRATGSRSYGGDFAYQRGSAFVCRGRPIALGAAPRRQLRHLTAHRGTRGVFCVMVEARRWFAVAGVCKARPKHPQAPRRRALLERGRVSTGSEGSGSEYRGASLD